MKSLAGVAAKIRPLRRHAFAGTDDARDGAGAGFGDGAERLLDDVGQPAALVAGAGVGAAVDRAAAEVFVVPGHLADEIARDVLVRRARGQQVNRVADLRDLGEHDRGAGADEQVRRIADGGVCGDAGEGIAAAALQADDEVRRGPSHAPALVQLLQALLGHLHDGRDHVAEAVVLLVLQAHDVGRCVQDRQRVRGQQPRRLQLFAAEADDHRRAAEVGIQARLRRVRMGISAPGASMAMPQP